MAKEKKRWFIPFITGLGIVISIIIGVFTIYDRLNSPQEERSSSNRDPVTTLTDTVIVEKVQYVNAPAIAQSEQRSFNLSDKISGLIKAFDQSSIDNINTQTRRSITDTLSDGTVQKRRVALLESKTSEETYWEMQSANSELIGLLTKHDLIGQYEVVLKAQEARLKQAGKQFSGNMNSPLFGL